MENAEENDLEDEDVDEKRGLHEDVEGALLICITFMMSVNR